MASCLTHLSEKFGNRKQSALSIKTAISSFSGQAHRYFCAGAMVKFSVFVNLGDRSECSALLPNASANLVTNSSLVLRLGKNSSNIPSQMVFRDFHAFDQAAGRQICRSADFCGGRHDISPSWEKSI